MASKKPADRALLKDAATTALRRWASSPRQPPIGHPYITPYDVAYEQASREQEVKFIEQLFRRADADCSGQIDFKEFNACLSQPETFRILNRRFGFQRHEAPRIFRALDGDGSGEICIDEWVATCRALMDIVKEGDVVTNWRLHSARHTIRNHSKGAPRRPVSRTHRSDPWASSKSTFRCFISKHSPGPDYEASSTSSHEDATGESRPKPSRNGLGPGSAGQAVLARTPPKTPTQRRSPAGSAQGDVAHGAGRSDVRRVSLLVATLDEEFN